MNYALKNNHLFILIPLILFLQIFTNSSVAQPGRIFLDGEFSDWAALTSIHSDPPGDSNSGVDFGKLWAANDAEMFYLRIELGAELNMQSDNTVVLYIDSDANAATGMSIEGIGAELEWQFGNRGGSYFHNGSEISINHFPLGLVTAPTVSSGEFEISLARDARPDGQNLLFPGNEIKIVFKDLTSGDILPNNGGGVTYAFSNDPLPPLAFPAIAKQHPASIRFLSYNVEVNGLFDPVRQPGMSRIIQAIQPEIIGFQEIYQFNADDVKSEIETILPSGGSQQWFSAKQGPDIIAVSRYPILQSFGIQGSNGSVGNGAFLIDLRPQTNSDLLFIVAHTPCCSNDFGRQQEIDAIMAFIRDAKAPGGSLTLAAGTPIVIVGDMNLVGDAQQLNTLRTGEIINTGAWGQPFSPDWDGTNFADLLPRHLNSSQFFTWFSPSSSFSPGRLDFLIFSDAVVDVLKSFVLFTRALPPDTLAVYNLQPLDDASSDHMPLVADLQFSPLTSVSTPLEIIPDNFVLHQNYPNPFNPTTVIAFELPKTAVIKLNIYNLSGSNVRTLLNQRISAGIHRLDWNGRNDAGQPVASGVYFYRLETNGFQQIKKMLLMR